MTSFDLRAELLALASSPSGIKIKNVSNFSKENTSKFEKQLDSKSFFSCLPPTSYSLDLEDLLLENSNTILTIPDGIDLLKNYIK